MMSVRVVPSGRERRPQHRGFDRIAILEATEIPIRRWLTMTRLGYGVVRESFSLVTERDGSGVSYRPVEPQALSRAREGKAPFERHIERTRQSS